MERGGSQPAPSFEQLKGAAVDLLALAEAEAEESERLYRQTDRMIEALRRTGLYAMLTPGALGGSELAFVEAMEIVELIARAEPSVGWCLMVQCVQGADAGPFLPDEGASAIYGTGADVTMAGQGVARGFAEPVDGGYLVRGDWGYGSGIHHAEWVHSGCFVVDDGKMRMDDNGRSVAVFVHHPKDTIELKGNWDVLGLRGTGSYDYTMKGGEVFVPATQCYPADNPTQRRGGIQYSSGIVGTTTWGHTSWALGVGRRVLDELAALARQRTDVFGAMHESASFRQSFAEAEARYRAARAFVYAAWDGLSEGYAKGERASIERIALARLAMRHIHDVISDVSTFAHRAARGVSLRPSVLQRCYRDIHAGTQHMLMADRIVQDCGKVLLGTAGEDAEWKIMWLQDD